MEWGSAGDSQDISGIYPPCELDAGDKEEVNNQSGRCELGSCGGGSGHGNDIGVSLCNIGGR